MTPGVNRDRFVSVQFLKCIWFEFPEGDVAVHLDGGSRFYEQISVKLPFSQNFHNPSDLCVV